MMNIFVLADYEAYCQAQSSVRDLYKDRSRWAKVCLTNIAKEWVLLIRSNYSTIC